MAHRGMEHGGSAVVATEVWALAEALGLAREAEALAGEWYEEYGEEGTLGMLASWLAEHGGTEVLASTEVGTDMEVWVGTEATRARALEGARRCEAYWAGEGEAEMLAEAVARTQRILDGTALVLDVEGALDWLA